MNCGGAVLLTVTQARSSRIAPVCLIAMSVSCVHSWTLPGCISVRHETLHLTAHGMSAGE